MLARRRLITGIAGVPLAAILADSRLSALAAEGTESVSITTKGGQKVSGALALPAKQPAAAQPSPEPQQQKPPQQQSQPQPQAQPGPTPGQQ